MKLGRRTLALAAVIGAVAAAPAPAGAAEGPPAVPGARAAIVIDARDGTVMFAKHPDAERAIASTTKLMTALLALEQAKPSDVFTAPAYNAMPAESRINLREGERMTVHDLLEALLLESANDAAETLAEGVSGSREAFVEEMNARAAELGLEHTSYANPIGLDEAGNYSSARDLAKPGARAAAAPALRQDRGHAGGGARVGRAAACGREPQRPDRRLSVGERREDGLYGERRQRARGRSGRARRRACDQRGARRADRDGTQLRDARPAAAGDSPASSACACSTRAGWSPRRTSSTTTAAPAWSHAAARSSPFAQGQHVRRRTNAPDEVKGPLDAGARVGTVTVLLDGRPVRRVALVTAEKVPDAGTLRVLLSWLGVPLTLLLLVAIVVAAVLVFLRLPFRIRIVR